MILSGGFLANLVFPMGLLQAADEGGQIRLLEWYTDGGPVMHILLVCSLISLFFIIERGWVFLRGRVNLNELVGKVRAALLKKDVQGAVKICESYRGPVAALTKAGILKVGSRREEVEKTLENAAIHEIARLERGLAVLATISNIAPIIGFLGTVMGMIMAFANIEKLARMEPREVAGGIKVALITTAGGLLVAVFTLPFYNFYMSRVSGFVREMETSANILVETMDEMDALKE